MLGTWTNKSKEVTMAQAGGSATINGILYQILGTLNWAANIHLKTQLAVDDIEEAILVIEPSKGGGDLRIEEKSKRTVEQWKARSSHGAWSINAVISEVIPDLYKAVDENALDDQTEYCFVSEGHQGKWNVARDFFSSLSSRTYTSDPLDALESTKKKRFFPKAEDNCTEREFFLIVADAVKENKGDELKYKKLWNLLVNFSFKESVHFDQLKADIDAILIDYVENDDVNNKRHELCGKILELASYGEVRITAHELLQKASLFPYSFKNWEFYQKRVLDVVQRKLAFKKYDSTLDVRKPLQIEDNIDVVVISAESGHGKTWHLARTSLEAFNTGYVGVFIPSKNSAEADLQEVAFILWTESLGHEKSQSLERIAIRINGTTRATNQPWAIICVDDVKTPHEAIDLIENNWRFWGVQLVISVSPQIARAIENRKYENVSIHKLQDFEPDELREYLRRRGRNWVDIRKDVLKLLQRPLITNLYCEIAAETDWVPTYEYDLFERYWRKAAVVFNAESPGEVGKFTDLIYTILEPNAVYPWSDKALRTCGINGKARTQWEKLGWLRNLESGAEIWHDRLLNWGVAVALNEKWVTGEITTEDVAEHLKRLYSNKPEFAGKSLGYVPMDLLWLVMSPDNSKRDQLPILISALEEWEGHNGYPETLYLNMLPTLGERAIEFLVTRLQDVLDSTYEKPYSRWISQALIKIGEVALKQVQTAATNLLQETHPILLQTAIKVFAELPCTNVVDRLWEIHVQNRRALDNTENNDRHWIYEQSHSALVACVKGQTAWIIHKIEQASGDEPVSELGFLLANSKIDVSLEQWQNIKQPLKNKLTNEKSRCLARCIQRFNDQAEIEYLESLLNIEQDLVRETTFSVLADIAPLKALSKMKEMEGHLYYTRGWWLPIMLQHIPNETRSTLYDMMLEKSDNPVSIALVYQGREDDMDAKTVDLLLDSLTSLLDKHFDEFVSNTRHGYYNSKMLSDVNKLELLERFEFKQGGYLEELLVKLCCAWGENPKINWHEWINLTNILCKIGGEGITTISNHLLSSEDLSVRKHGLFLSLIAPNAQTKALLVSIAEKDQDTSQGQIKHEKHTCIYQLFALNESKEALVQFFNYEYDFGWHDLSTLRTHLRPMPDEAVDIILNFIDSAGLKTRLKAIKALGMSGRTDHQNRLVEILKKHSTCSETVNAIMFSLIQLQYGGDEIIPLLESCVHNGIAPHYACQYLMKRGYESSFQVLFEFLNNSASNQFHDKEYKLDIALELMENPAWRHVVTKYIFDGISELRVYKYRPKFLEVIGDLNTKEARDLLYEEAYPENYVFHGVQHRLSAIRGLSRIDVVEAFNAALKLLSENGEGKLQVPELLIEIDRDRAVSLLISHLIEEKDILTRQSICTVVRYDFLSPVLHQINAMMQSSDTRHRLAAIEIAAWQTGNLMHELLHELAIQDPDSRVRTAARNALQRHHAVDEIFALMDAYPQATGSRKWSMLDSMINLGEPTLLSSRDDVLYLGKILNNEPRYVIDYANEMLEKKTKKLEEDAKRASA